MSNHQQFIEFREGGRIPSLDGLRAFSIALVLLGHSIADEKHSFVFRLLFLHAGLGVRIFFVISGFLITTLLLTERATFGGISLKLFYCRRALRILPAFGAFVAVVFALSALGVVDMPSRLWLFVLTYTLNFTRTVWVVGHLWSLSVEEQFYLLWPLGLGLCRMRTCVWLATLTLFAGPLFRLSALLTGVELVPEKLLFASPRVCGPIAVGCLLAIYAPSVRKIFDSHKWTSDLTIVAVFTAIVLDAIDIGSASHPVAAFCIFVQAHARVSLDAEIIAGLIKVITDLILGAGVARFIFIPHGWGGNVLNSRQAAFIGKLSYSLYLWQQLFLNPYSTARWIRFPLDICAAVIAASISYYAIELPFLNLRSRFRRAKVADTNVACAALMGS